MPTNFERLKGRQSIAAFLAKKVGTVAGFLRTDHKGRCVLRDVSGEMVLPDNLAVVAPCWLGLSFTDDGQTEVLYQQSVNANSEVTRLQADYGQLKRRWSIYQEVRRFFLEQEFLEVDTPVAVACPGMEPFLDSWPIDNNWLRTSPELHLKRLLAGGYDRIFQIGPCFRKGDLGRLHREEFHMLEWYRVFADLDSLIQDIGALLTHLAPLATDPDFFRSLPDLVTCQEVFAKYLDMDLIDTTDKTPLRDKLDEMGITYAQEDDWDTLYFLLFLNFIEPKLGRERPLILCGYPASQAALARKAPQQPGVFPTCFRLELYVRGSEIANGFDELVDPREQRARFEAERKVRNQLGKPVYPMDEPFLTCLESGLPPSAGIALGMDRLVLALLDLTDMDQILPFHPE